MELPAAKIKTKMREKRASSKPLHAP